MSPMYPGAITDIRGLKVGHHTLVQRPTGCTVVLCEAGATCGVDVRGAAPGTRETDLLKPDNLVEQVHAVLLCGGSAFGLDAAGGVMRWLDEHGHGYAVGRARVPIVPAAVLFDLWLGDERIRPGADDGYAACQAAGSATPEQGSVGAGAGASVGKMFGWDRAMKGGIGSASLRVGAFTVAALVAVNALGDVVDPHDGSVIAGARGADGAPMGSMTELLAGRWPKHLSAALAGSATTIGVVATDAVLSKAQANKLATMAHDGLARCINPVHTMHDGDTLFALATGAAGASADLSVLGAVVAQACTHAVINAVRAARGSADLPAAAELKPGPQAMAPRA